MSLQISVLDPNFNNNSVSSNSQNNNKIPPKVVKVSIRQLVRHQHSSPNCIQFEAKSKSLQPINLSPLPRPSIEVARVMKAINDNPIFISKGSKDLGPFFKEFSEGNYCLCASSIESDSTLSCDLFVKKDNKIQKLEVQLLINENNCLVLPHEDINFKRLGLTAPDEDFISALNKLRVEGYNPENQTVNNVLHVLRSQSTDVKGKTLKEASLTNSIVDFVYELIKKNVKKKYGFDREQMEVGFSTVCEILSFKSVEGFIRSLEAHLNAKDMCLDEETFSSFIRKKLSERKLEVFLELAKLEEWAKVRFSSKEELENDLKSYLYRGFKSNSNPIDLFEKANNSFTIISFHNKYYLVTNIDCRISIAEIFIDDGYILENTYFKNIHTLLEGLKSRNLNNFQPATKPSKTTDLEEFYFTLKTFHAPSLFHEFFHPKVLMRVQYSFKSKEYSSFSEELLCKAIVQKKREVQYLEQIIADLNIQLKAIEKFQNSIQDSSALNDLQKVFAQLHKNNYTKTYDKTAPLQITNFEDWKLAVSHKDDTKLESLINQSIQRVKKQIESSLTQMNLLCSTTECLANCNFQPVNIDTHFLLNEIDLRIQQEMALVFNKSPSEYQQIDDYLVHKGNRPQVLHIDSILNKLITIRHKLRDQIAQEYALRPNQALDQQISQEYTEEDVCIEVAEMVGKWVWGKALSEAPFKFSNEGYRRFYDLGFRPRHLKKISSTPEFITLFSEFEKVKQFASFFLSKSDLHKKPYQLNADVGFEYFFDIGLRPFHFQEIKNKKDLYKFFKKNTQHLSKSTLLG